MDIIQGHSLQRSGPTARNRSIFRSRHAARKFEPNHNRSLRRGTDHNRMLSESNLLERDNHGFGMSTRTSTTLLLTQISQAKQASSFGKSKYNWARLGSSLNFRWKQRTAAHPDINASQERFSIDGKSDKTTSWEERESKGKDRSHL